MIVPVNYAFRMASSYIMLDGCIIAKYLMIMNASPKPLHAYSVKKTSSMTEQPSYYMWLLLLGHLLATVIIKYVNTLMGCTSLYIIKCFIIINFVCCIYLASGLKRANIQLDFLHVSSAQ